MSSAQLKAIAVTVLVVVVVLAGISRGPAALSKFVYNTK